MTDDACEVVDTVVIEDQHLNRGFEVLEHHKSDMTNAVGYLAGSP